MGKKMKIILVFIILISITLCGAFFVKKLLSRNSELINISYLSEEFVDSYYKKLSSFKSNEEKENMLIVVSQKKIKNSYGAKDIIEAPNNQYILQYENEKDKKYALEQLKSDKSIKSIEENIIYTIDTAYNSWGIEAMALDYAIDSADTSNLNSVGVAVIDTGCNTSLFNKYYYGRMSGFYDVLNDSTTSIYDTSGHGTHVSGTVAEGTPSNVKIFPVKVSEDGNMFMTDIIAGINYVVYYETASVINMSFGGYEYNYALDETIDAANEKNVICVAAAGNDNVNYAHYPSAQDNTISIASVDSSLNKSGFSNYGSTITFTAPGTAIKSIMYKDTDSAKKHGNQDGDDHETISGTSMATPHAAAAVAILKSYNKDLNQEKVISKLQETAIDLGDAGWDEYYGYGFISFDNVQFCDNKNCDEDGVYKSSDKSITNIELIEQVFTGKNYHSETNLMASRVRVSYADSTNEEMLLGELPGLNITNYSPDVSGSQNITIKSDNISINVNITNPSFSDEGWTYSSDGNGGLEITGYSGHNLEINRLYIPTTIGGVNVTSIADNVKFSELSNDFLKYQYLYLPSHFTKIGTYAFSNTGIKYVDGENTSVDVGDYAFDSSSIKTFSIPLKNVGNHAFANCSDLHSVNISGIYSYTTSGNKTVSEISIGDYAFYNCKKLVKVSSSIYDIVDIDKIGQYAFYDCLALMSVEGSVMGEVGDYAFYNCLYLTYFNLYNADSIGSYAFFGSGIAEAIIGLVDEVGESSFENCKNLRNISITRGIIESRAFWNSGVEYVSIGSSVTSIAEDAFAYAPLIGSSSGNDGSGTYDVIYGLGIVEKSTNKLIVGFTNGTGASNVSIPDNITKIGNYAFTGNSNLNNIVIPSTVSNIGTHAFEDCYQLSRVYFLGDSISFSDSTFSRSDDGEIQAQELIVYVHKNDGIKDYVDNKGLNYRHIEPDEVVVDGGETEYDALSTIDTDSLTVKLIYHEKQDREEILSTLDYNHVGVLGNGYGYTITYQNGNYFKYGDSNYFVNTRNELGYEFEGVIPVTINKIDPDYTVPTDITAYLGQKLKYIDLPSGFEWVDDTILLNETGDIVCNARFIPEDTDNYNIIENIHITISVSNDKTVIIPNITVAKKTYDESDTISSSNITIDNLEDGDYSIVSAKSSSEDVGERTASIIIKLSSDKYNNYCFENGTDEQEFTASVTITKAELNAVDTTEDVTVQYDNNPHNIIVSIDYPNGINVLFQDDSGEYTLVDTPQYTEIGTYVIKYKVFKNDNYTEYYGERTLNIIASKGYEINNYTVDDVNNYITDIIINTEVNTFTPNIILSYGYGIYVDSKNIDGKDLLYTGGKTTITFGTTTYKEFTNVVIGDTNGDAVINSGDLLRIRQHLLNSNHLTGVYFLASDINGDNSVNSGDLLRVRQHLLGTIPIE